MNIYWVFRTEDVEYDEVDEFVAIAPDADGVRALFANNPSEDGPGCEGPEAWLNPWRSECVLIGRANPSYTAPTLVSRSFNAG